MSSPLLGLALFGASAMCYIVMFRNSKKPVSSSRLSYAEALCQLEVRISLDEGSRGIGPLVVPGSLSLAGQHLSRLPPGSHVVILTGFPCCMTETPPTETDGPSGALAIARAAVSLGLNVLLLTDECNEEVVMSLCFGAGDWCGGGRLTLESFPPERDWTEEEARRLIDIAENRCDHVVSIERPGPSADGRCYTMRGLDMSHLLAPLHRVVDLARDSGKPSLKLTSIGDGGNELGMGNVRELIVASTTIKHGEKIACAVACDFLVVASVSNWGGYALAAAAGLAREADVREAVLQGGGGAATVVAEDSLATVPKRLKGRYLPTLLEEAEAIERVVDAGGRDGCTGKLEVTVDGMPLETSLKCLQDITDICARVPTAI